MFIKVEKKSSQSPTEQQTTPIQHKTRTKQIWVTVVWSAKVWMRECQKDSKCQIDDKATGKMITVLFLSLSLFLFIQILFQFIRFSSNSFSAHSTQLIQCGRKATSIECFSWVKKAFDSNVGEKQVNKRLTKMANKNEWKVENAKKERKRKK